MDAVQLNYPVDVAVAAAAVVPKLVGSEKFGGDRDVVNGVEVSVLLCSAGSIEPCNSLITEKGMNCSVNTLEPTSCDNLRRAELCGHSSQLPSFTCEDSYKQLCCRGISGPSWTPIQEEMQVQKGAAKVSRNNGGCSKRQRMAPLEDMTGQAVMDNTNDVSEKLGLCLTKCESHEKTRLTKQRNNSSSKRVDRRTLKVSMKNKHDLFSAKATFGCFNSSGGGDNILGLYGLKTDADDITKLVDDLSLNDLLDGTHQCPSLGKDKGKKALERSKSIMRPVRNAWSILHSTPNEKIATCSSSSVSIMSSGDNLDPSTADMSSSNKDCCRMPETPVNLLDFSLHQPKDTLECLALPPPKDLEFLLLDAAKPAVSSRHAADPRPFKQMSRRVTFPPFAWSHNLNAHSKTNSDTAKLLPSRSTCQGRWVNIGNITSSHEAARESFTDLESLTYDESLVPSYETKRNAVPNGVTSFLSLPSVSGTLSTAASMTSSVPLESGGELKHQEKVEDCPTLLAAAQTLCDIAAHISRLNQDGMMKWPKKPSQRAMKAGKSKLTGKYEENFPASTSSMASDHRMRSGSDQIIPSKRPKLSVSRNKRDVGHINGLRKGLLNWSTPRSSRSSPNKSTQDTIGGTRHSTTCKVKEEPFMKPPPAKVPDRNCNGQPKVWKLMRVDCKRECEE